MTGSYVFSRRPLTVTRLNDAAVTAVEALDETQFEHPEDVAERVGMDRDAVASLFSRLHQRGLLEWAPDFDTSFQPFVSVVVTTRDADAALGPCLDALANLDYPRYEVVVVDDGSTDDTVDVAQSHPLSSNGSLRVIEVGTAADPLGIGASRNHGVGVARGSLVAFTDADCRPRSDWLSTLVPRLAVHDVVGGRVRPAGTEPVDSYEGINSSLDMGPYGARVDPDGSTPYLPTANLVGATAVFESLRFPERNVAEDVEFCWRAVEAGYDVVYEPAGVVEHAFRDIPSSFAGRRATYAESEALLAHRFGRGDRVTLSGTGIVGFLLLWLAFVGGLSGQFSLTTSTALLVGGLGSVVGPSVVRGYDVSRKLDGIVSDTDIVESTLRSGVSTLYAVTRELSRYYSGPLTLVGVTLIAAGAALSSPLSTAAGVGVLGVVALAVALPALAEYFLHRPSSIRSYLTWFVLDHGGYQYGAYAGAVHHRTIAHLAPWRRFEVSGVVGSLVSVLRRRNSATESLERHVSVGTASAVFRVQTDAERWWFDPEESELGGETPVLSALLSDVCPDDHVLDVGANVGLYTCLAGDILSDGTVVAVEPDPANADALTENLDRNGVDARVCRVALSDRDGQGVLERVPGGAGVGEHTLTHWSPQSDEPTDGVVRHVVETTTGDALLDGLVPSVVKIDVEGGEMAVLRGLSDTLSRDACRSVYCEVHPEVLAERGETPDDIVSALSAAGFEIDYFSFSVGEWRTLTDDRPTERHVLRGRRSNALDT